MTIRVQKRDVMTETEVEGGRAMSKATWLPLEDGKGKYTGSALELLERMQPSPLVLGLLTSRTVS